MICKRLGVNLVTGIDRNQHKLDIAKQVGFDNCLTSNKMFKEREFTPQKLADLLIEAIDNKELLNTMGKAMQSIAKPHAAEDLANWLETFL